MDTKTRAEVTLKLLFEDEGICRAEDTEYGGPPIDEERCLKIIRASLSDAGEMAQLEILREAARKTCSYCATPVGQMCSVATMVQGSWTHYIHDNKDWGEHCEAGVLHSMIVDLVKEKEDDK